MRHLLGLRRKRRHRTGPLGRVHRTVWGARNVLRRLLGLPPLHVEELPPKDGRAAPLRRVDGTDAAGAAAGPDSRNTPVAAEVGPRGEG